MLLKRFEFIYDIFVVLNFNLKKYYYDLLSSFENLNEFVK